MHPLIDFSIDSVATTKAWDKIGLKPHHGIAVPLFSIYTKQSCGIGEFYDLIPLVKWCKQIGFDVIQLLPLNDSHLDASPYNAISSCALHPIFLSLHKLPYLEKLPTLQEKISKLQKLNKKPRLSYIEILIEKKVFLREYFEKTIDFFKKEEDFDRFHKENPWLITYSLFVSIKEKVSNTFWKLWPDEYQIAGKESIKPLMDQFKHEIAFYSFMQYLSYKQFKEVAEYCLAEKVHLMGDIPILVSPDSADVWEKPHLFNLELAAGAPPDAYNSNGQYWGFPLYRWDEMEKEDFAFWKQRLQYAEQFYSLYRLDHAVGFFRIWAIEPGKKASEGFYIPSDESKWYEQGKKILSTLCTLSNMLPIAEDLGNIPPMVRPCLAELGICGTKVMRWERRWHGDLGFIALSDYYPLSLTCLSTHDSPTLGSWWKNMPEESQVLAKEKGWPYQPILPVSERCKLIFDSHHTTSLFHVNLLTEYLALFSELVSEDPEEDRVNRPGVVSDKNWNYKLKISLEKLSKHRALKALIKNLIH